MPMLQFIERNVPFQHTSTSPAAEREPGYQKVAWEPEMRTSRVGWIPTCLRASGSGGLIDLLRPMRPVYPPKTLGYPVRAGGILLIHSYLPSSLAPCWGIQLLMNLFVLSETRDSYQYSTSRILFLSASGIGSAFSSFRHFSYKRDFI